MKRIVLFGDSIMAGFHDGMLSNVFTDRIKQAFPADEVINISFPGYKTSDAIPAVKQVTKLKPDVCVLEFGVNDISTFYEVKPGKFSANLNQIISEIGYDKTILLSPPYTDWKVNLRRPWTRQLQFELVTEHLSKQYDIAYVDLLHKMAAQDHVEDLLQNDGLHFTTKGYDLMEKLLVPQIKKSLSNGHKTMVSN